MIICPYDTCIGNEEGVCVRKNVVLEIANTEDDSLKCASYQREERNDENVRDKY